MASPGGNIHAIPLGRVAAGITSAMITWCYRRKDIRREAPYHRRRSRDPASSGKRLRAVELQQLASGSCLLEICKGCGCESMPCRGADIAARDVNGRTPLHVASTWSRIETIRALVDSGAHIEARDVNGRTPLHMAALSGTLETVRMLLEAGAHIEAPDSDGLTPLYLASASGFPGTVRALLDAGAYAGARTAKGIFPADLAENNERVRNDPVFWELNDARWR